VIELLMISYLVWFYFHTYKMEKNDNEKRWLHPQNV